MPKRAVSLTLEEDNLQWVRSQAAGTRRRSLSDAVDQIITAARKSGDVLDASITSVVKTVEIHPDDPNLDAADMYVAELFAQSTSRSLVVRDKRPRFESTAAARRRKPVRG
jgi:hypothetical protein